jgi:hypothetical protein
MHGTLALREARLAEVVMKEIKCPQRLIRQAKAALAVIGGLRPN